MKYFPAHCRQASAGADLVFLTDTFTGDCHTLPSLQVRVFSQLFGCRAPEQHAEQLLMCDLPGMNRDLAQRLVASWIQKGLLQPETRLHMEASPLATASAAPSAIEAPEARFSFCCCTASRPAALHAWLHEHIQFMSSNAAVLQETLIIEDSRNRVDIAQNSETVQKFQGSTGIPVRALDRAARRRMIDGLCQDLPELAGTTGTSTREILEFAFLGEHRAIGSHTSLGAARNTALLCGTAPVLNFCDDDIRAEFISATNGDRSHPQGVPLLLSSPRPEVRFFPDAATLEAESVRSVGYPIYDSIMNAFSWVGTNLDLSSAGPELLTLFRDSCQVSVHAVSTGYCGARPYEHPFRTFLFRHEHAEHLLESRAAFELIHRNPLLIRHCSSSVLDGGLSFSPGFSALDVRNPGLPFFPVGRREDDIYRTMYRMCFPEQLFANLPVAAFHDPEYKAAFSDREFTSYLMDVGTWIHILTQRFAGRLNHSEGAERLREIAMSFRELSSLSPENLRRFLSPLHRAHYQAMINHIGRELELYTEPPWWVAERHHALSVLQREQASGPGETEQQLQNYLAMYRLWGDLLELWPQIVELKAGASSRQSYFDSPI